MEIEVFEIVFLSSKSSGKFIVMLPCNSDNEVEDKWVYTVHKQFKHQYSGLCIGEDKIKKFTPQNPLKKIFSTDRKNLDKNFVHAAVCDSHSPSQQWEFQKSSSHREF